MADQKFCALTVRKLKPGSYDAFRAGWDPSNSDGDFPPFIERMFHVRSVEDPDQVISFGLGGGDPDEIRSLMEQPEWKALEERRQAAMAPHVAETIVDGIFVVADEIVPARA